MTRPKKRKTKGKQRKAPASPKRRAKPATHRPKSRKTRAKPKKVAARSRARSRLKAKAVSHRRKTVTAKKRTKPTRKRLFRDPRMEVAIKDMNRGVSLTAAAHALSLSPTELQAFIKARRLGKRHGSRWVVRDMRARRVLVMTGGLVRKMFVNGYAEARLVGEHTHAVGQFVQTNDIGWIKPFEGQNVELANGRKVPLETDPNALHRLAAMDTPPFHEIYQVTSNT